MSFYFNLKALIILITSRAEAITGALPIGQNSPQKCPYGLYAEKISGTAFTAPRWENQQTWVYRIIPSAVHSSFKLVEDRTNCLKPVFHQLRNQLRWDPFDLNPTASWLDGLHLVAGAGDPAMKSGVGYYIYAPGRSIAPHTATYSADDDLLIVPQMGALDITTEMGRLLVRPNETCVIPRGIRCCVNLADKAAPIRGYILELYQGRFTLPELGPIGSNCLANARDFQIPVAAYTHDTTTEWTIYNKFCGQLFTASQTHTPFDVVVWEGRVLPVQIRSRPLQHDWHDLIRPPGPVAQHRAECRLERAPGHRCRRLRHLPAALARRRGHVPAAPYHCNVMSEFMGLIHSSYIANEGGKGGFQPAGASLHNVMSSHRPDAVAFEKATNEVLAPVKVGTGSMAFMFESCFMISVTEWGLKTCCKV